MRVAFANAKATHIFFSKHISIYAIFNGQSFNNTLTNDIISFEQLDPDLLHIIVSSPEHEVLMVSYCGQSVSVVRHPSCVVRHASSIIALKAYSSYTPGPID